MSSCHHETDSQAEIMMEAAAIYSWSASVSTVAVQWVNLNDFDMQQGTWHLS